MEKKHISMAHLLLIMCLPFVFGEQRDSLFALNDALASDPFNPQILEVHGELIEVIRETDEGLINLKHACLLREADLVLDDSNQSVFQKMESRDLVSWNAIIVGYVANGYWLRALDLFQELISANMFEPNSATHVSVLSAFAHLKDLQVGKVIHGYILRYSCLYAITSMSNALVSFYAKYNDIGAAYQTFMMIPRRDLVSWKSMIDVFAEFERKEASTLPIQVERKEASALPIQVERNEASALPIQVERKEASALPIQIERKEASTLLIQIERIDVSYFRFECSSFHQEG
ncbi:hypothetical protein F3Y22_tig00110258pilonHSYRG00023 [Hibiscus syriacus]|uniref:Uncharacterized protein n=1 Tax=Hibiscus syriacus TaxID=106335 RepID=A0A6A3B561_HIBSY|nr:hypothetical protein F3Y22_tig00110258pilonHSYRG00023 [Hibiscus syriacus]